MGGTLQKVLQGRGKQAVRGIKPPGRYSLRIKRIIPPFLLLVAYATMALGLPAARPPVWFFFSLVPAMLYSYLAFIKRQGKYTVETLSSFGVLMAGTIQALGHEWLHIAYAPFLIMLSTIYGPETIIPLGISVLLLEVRHLMYGNLIEEVSFSIIIASTAITTSVIFSRMRKERDRIKRSLTSITEEARDIDSATDMGIISDEGLISQHLSSTIKANEEIRESLLIIKQLLSADSASMLALREGSLSLRCSTEENPSIGFDRALLEACIRKRQSIIYDPAKDAGHIAVSSLIASPVIDGSYVTGVIAVEGKRHGAFNSSDLKILQMFSNQVSRALQRERINSQIKRAHSGLRILHEGSSRLVTSLKVEVIARRLIEASYKIAPLSIALFVQEGDRFELLHQLGFLPPEERFFSFRGTLIGMFYRNREPVYLSDLRNNRTPLLPFKTGEAGSIFMLPLIYEKEQIGILVFLSERVNALSPYQIELLEVLGNQASTSLINARLYSEVERLAITDGLTGLFNHRHFQERLAEEFKRLQRLPDPISLLLIDIDFFKRINDTFGHPAGDEILRGVAGVIKATIRDTDIPARYGGEEFAAVLLGTNHEGAQIMAERLRRSVMDKRFYIDGNEIRVTVSIGTATSPYDAGNREGLIEKADQALYYAKRNGRNRCVLYNEIK